MTTLLAVLLSAPGNPFLIEAREQYQALDFERCLARLQQAATQWKSTPAELRDIEVYGGLCTFSLGRTADAKDHFRTALRIDEATELPPYTSPKAVDLFLAVKLALRAPPEPLPDVDLPPDAPRRATLEPRAAAAQPTSFLTRHPAAVAFAATSVVALAIGVGLGVSARGLAAEANAARADADYARLAGNAQANAIAANVTYGVAGAAAVAAVVAVLIEGAASPP